MRVCSTSHTLFTGIETVLEFFTEGFSAPALSSHTAAAKNHQVVHIDHLRDASIFSVTGSVSTACNEQGMLCLYLLVPSTSDTFFQTTSRPTQLKELT